ncbi:lamin tail domain-containing protein [Aeoliella straminimaris]|uniref:lamin tail domain-containing protein n=1 Tax=Aeoliella straminimaris TaxID=2954799 RepID=UPI0020926566|nr:lamin tail domain-containing protein [Aeoliella straminimaris]
MSCLLALAALLFVALPHRVPGEVVVSEIMYNPGGSDRDDGTDGYNREWVELFNTGQSGVDLSGWSVGDSQDGDFTSPFPAGTFLQPGAALVVTGDASTFDSEWGAGIPRVQVDNFPTLANSPSATNETVAIRDASGVMQNMVNYQNSGAWPLLNGSNGHSLMLLPQGLSSFANGSGANWIPSFGGTYGAKFVESSFGNTHASPGSVSSVTQEPFAPSPDAAWSMVILPDTQNYAKDTANRAIFTEMTEWIRDQRQEYNIQLVMHEGDIVNNNNTDNPTSGNQTSSQQWSNAKEAMSVLDGEVPYILAAGNHDFGTTNAQNRQTFVNEYFSYSDNSLVDPALGGILRGIKDPGRIENAYYEFTAPDGRDMLVIALEWEPRPATVAWANRVVSQPEFEDHTAILLTHAYVQGQEARYINSRVDEDASGEDLWQELVKANENFEMVFNGHFGGDGAGYIDSVGTGGNHVHQMFFNAQFLTNGGAGFLRVVEFLDDGSTVRVRTYSPHYDVERMDEQFSFEFSITPTPGLPAGDYNDDGVVDMADYTVWRNHLGAPADTLPNDPVGGVIGAAQYDTWKDSFGNSRASRGTATYFAVPEPGAIVLILLMSLATRVFDTKRWRIRYRGV